MGSSNKAPDYTGLSIADLYAIIQHYKFEKKRAEHLWNIDGGYTEDHTYEQHRHNVELIDDQIDDVHNEIHQRLIPRNAQTL